MSERTSSPGTPERARAYWILEQTAVKRTVWVLPERSPKLLWHSKVRYVPALRRYRITLQ